MTVRIATFNVENLFQRPIVMLDDLGERGQAALDDFSQMSSIIRKVEYSATDKSALLIFNKKYQFTSPSRPKDSLIDLIEVRRRLFSAAGGSLHVQASGRNDWTGWFSLRKGDVTWEATHNTGRVIAETNADVQIVVEVEDRVTLARFNDQILGAVFGKAYPHVMLIDGNDERGIDVGIMSRFPIRSIRSHVDDRNPNGVPTFSRDCPEYLIELPSGHSVLVLPNHFKSKRGGDTPAMRERRAAQARRAHEIAVAGLSQTPLVLIGGDLNDSPDFDLFAPLWADGFADVKDHPSYPADRPGTYGTGLAQNKIDYLIMSPDLGQLLKGTGIERRGCYHPRTWVPYDTVTSEVNQASDHHLVWADFDI